MKQQFPDWVANKQLNVKLIGFQSIIVIKHLTFKIGLSPSKQNSFYFLQWKSFKNDEKCFLFYLKSSFGSQDIYVFAATFWSCRKSNLIRKIRLTSEFMTSQTGLETIAIHILSNISQSKGDQSMKFGQLIEYNKRNIYYSSNIMQKMRQGD